MDPQALRKQIRERRKALPLSERLELSRRAIQKLSETDLLQSAQKIALYRSMPEELDVSTLTESLVRRGVQVYFPEVTGTEIQFGVAAQALDVVIVPGVAFSESLHRMGMGKGFYDRFLPDTRRDCLKIALAFDFQVTPLLEELSRPWDVRVDWVFTESRTLGPR